MRALLAGRDDVEEKKMFGGVGFILAGHMAVAAQRTGNLLVRIDPEESDELTADSRVDFMVMRGREMPGWLTVHGSALEDEEALRGRVARGVTYAGSLPPK